MLESSTGKVLVMCCYSSIVLDKPNNPSIHITDPNSIGLKPHLNIILYLAKLLNAIFLDYIIEPILLRSSNSDDPTF